MLPPDTSNELSMLDVPVADAPADAQAGGQAPPTPAMRARMTEGLAEVIDEVGYRASRVRDIARAARMSLTTFYLAYPSKEECLVDLAGQLERGAELWVAARAELAEGPWAEALDAALRDAFHAALSRPQLSYALLVELGGIPGDPRRTRQAALADFAPAAADAIERVRVRAGEPSGRRLTESEAAFVTAAVVEGCIDLLVAALEGDDAGGDAMRTRIDALAGATTDAIVRLAR